MSTGAARAPQRRSITARELAERLGSSERTARRLIAEPRDEFLERAKVRRDRVVALRRQGMKYKDIAEEMGISTGAVGRILHDARKLEERKTQSVTPADLDSPPWQPEPLNPSTTRRGHRAHAVPERAGAHHPLRTELPRPRTRRTPRGGEMMARAEAGDVYDLLAEITAVLHGLHPGSEVTDEQIQNTRYWMLGQVDNPLEPAP
ncbi:hypothetical protein GS891_25930 [Rhodococcus hoagii]|nr:hypothetical protein [Prescottella equi]